MSKPSLKEIIKEEYARCAIDPVHFFKKYTFIQHPATKQHTKGKINFNLYRYQENCLEDFDKYRFIIINKGRQLGLSTLVAGHVLHQMIFKSDFNALVIATQQDVAKNLVTKIRTMHQLLPSWLQAETEEDNKLNLRFKNGSQVKASAATESAGRSEALSLLVIDEAAHIEPRLVNKIWTASQSTLSTGGNAILLSSPFGTGNLFHKIWTQAGDGKEFHPIFLPWYVHPDRDQAWRDQQDVLLGEKMAQQENDCSFLTSGNTVIDGIILKWYQDTHEAEPLEKRGFDGNYWVWEYPDFRKSYITVVDVARGDGSDGSAILVMETDTMKQVAEYNGDIGTTELGNLAVAIATEWNNSLLAIENVGIGWAVVQVAIDREYRNIFYYYKDDPYLDDKHLLHGYDFQDKSKMTPGVNTSGKTRPVMISKLEVSFRHKLPICRSKRSLDQLLTFIWKNGRAEAQEGYNDDLPMAWAIALWLRDTAIRLRQDGIDMNKALLDSFVRDIIIPKQEDDRVYRQHLGNGEYDDLRWLLD